MSDTKPIWHLDGEDEKHIYHYKGCGLDDVYLKSGYDIEETPYGTGIRVKNLDSLHIQIGLYLVKFRKSLSGKEIRFLRHQIDLTQSELARFFGCNVQQVARYEKNTNKLTGPADRLLRIIFEEHAKQEGSARDLLELLDAIDDTDNSNIILADVDGQWKVAC